MGACRQSCICVKVGQNVPRSAPGALRGRRWTCLPSELLSVAVQLFFPQPEWWIEGQVRRMSTWGENIFTSKRHYDVIWFVRTYASFQTGSSCPQTFAQWCTRVQKIIQGVRVGPNLFNAGLSLKGTFSLPIYAFHVFRWIEEWIISSWLFAAREFTIF